MRAPTPWTALAALAFGPAAGSLAQSADTARSQVVTDATWSNPAAVAIDESNGFAYAADKGSLSLRKIDLSTGAVAASISMPEGSGVESIQMAVSVLDGAHKHLWVHRSDNTLAVFEIDPARTFAQITRTGSLTLPAPAADLAVDDAVHRVFLACPSAGRIAAFDDSAAHGAAISPAGFSPVALPRGSVPARLAVADAPGVARRLFIADRGAAGLVRTMDTATGELGSIEFTLPSPAPHYIWDVAFNSGTATPTAMVLASVRGGQGDGLVSFDPASPTQLSGLDLAGAVGGNKIGDLVAYSATASDTASQVLVVRGADSGIDGGVAVFALMASDTATLTDRRAFPASAPLAVTGEGTAGGGFQNLAADPVRRRFYVVHEGPLHVHGFEGDSGAACADRGCAGLR